MMLDSISWNGAMTVGKAIEFAPNAGLGDGWDECEQRPTADMDSSQHRSTAEERTCWSSLGRRQQFPHQGKEEKEGRCLQFGAKGDNRDGGAELENAR